MSIVTIHEAKTHLSRLIQEVLAGGDVTITQGRTGEELVKLVPAKPARPRRRVPGRYKHIARSEDILAHGFWDRLTDEEAGLSTEIEPRP